MYSYRTIQQQSAVIVQPAREGRAEHNKRPSHDARPAPPRPVPRPEPDTNLTHSQHVQLNYPPTLLSFACLSTTHHVSTEGPSRKRNRRHNNTKKNPSRHLTTHTKYTRYCSLHSRVTHIAEPNLRAGLPPTRRLPRRPPRRRS